MRRVAADVKANVTIWRRSPSAVFFTLAFPILLMLIFGSIFGGDGQAFTLAVQDNDHSPQSAQLLEALNATGSLELTMIAAGRDAGAVARDADHHTTLVVPAGYGADVQAGRTATLELLTDPSSQASATTQAVVASVVEAFDQRLSGARERIAVSSMSVYEAGGEDGDDGDDGAAGPSSYIDFFLPGVIGLTIATNALIGGLEQSATLKQSGIMRKIATTPIGRSEWVLAKAAYQVLLGLLTAGVIIVVGVLFFGVQLRWGWEWPLMLVLAGAAFAGMALIVSRWVHQPDHANAAGSAIAFPMMFLAGTFWPLESMPPVLETVGKLLPLTYVNEGLRAAMITGNVDQMMFNGVVVAGMAVVFLAAGAALVRWKEV